MNSAKGMSSGAAPGIDSGDDAASEMWRWMRRDLNRWRAEAALGAVLTRSLLREPSLERALVKSLARKLADADVPANVLESLFHRLVRQDHGLTESCAADLHASVTRDPACESPCEAFLFFKGYQALQVYRLAHRLWSSGDTASACWLQSRCSALFGVDIHPAASIGDGIFVDHATGIVIGETAAVGDRVSLLHGVTLGGTGKEGGDRHPKVGDDVTISANATVLGNIRIGAGARIGACTVVLSDVPPGSTVVGNPGEIVRQGHSRYPAPTTVQIHPTKEERARE